MLYEKVVPTPQSSFNKRIFTYKYFPLKWHYHKEYELIIIKKGFGKRFIGQGVEPFREGDLVLIGNNVAHFHLSDPIFYKDNEMYCESDVIQFSRDIFPENSANMQEFSTIKNMLATSIHGIHFTNKAIIEKCVELFAAINVQTNLERLISLYKMLGILSCTTEFRLCSVYSSHDNHDSSPPNTPVIKTYEYLISNFKEMITLPVIADKVGQNPAALCRSFKKNTGKSIFDALSEIRIGAASRLLLNSSLPITDIAFESGYRNISHFNHQFKNIIGLSPSAYRKMYLESKEQPATV